MFVKLAGCQQFNYNAITKELWTRMDSFIVLLSVIFRYGVAGPLQHCACIIVALKSAVGLRRHPRCRGEDRSLCAATIRGICCVRHCFLEPDFHVHAHASCGVQPSCGFGLAPYIPRQFKERVYGARHVNHRRAFEERGDPPGAGERRG